MPTTKVIGWGKDSVKETVGTDNSTWNDIVINSTALSVEEGEEMEAQIEGGSAEARKKQPDKYVLDFERRIGDASEVSTILGFTEKVDSVQVIPEETGAIGVTLTNPSRYVTVTFDSTDGLKAHYQYKTCGTTGNDGKLNDIAFQAKS